MEKKKSADQQKEKNQLQKQNKNQQNLKINQKQLKEDSQSQDEIDIETLKDNFRKMKQKLDKNENESYDEEESEYDEDLEDEMDENMSEGGEDEIKEEDAGIDFNYIDSDEESDHLEKKQDPQQDDSDSEENIVSNFINKKMELKKLREKDDFVQKLEQTETNQKNKKQKVKEDELNDGKIINPDDYQRDMAEVKRLLGKDSEIPDKEKGTLTVDFEYVAPCEAYYHVVRSLLNQFLDGPEQEKLNLSSMTDYILERASIGSVIASSLGNEDPENNPEYAKLNDEEFEKIALKLNGKRDVYGVISILSLTYSRLKIDWLNEIYNYVQKRADKYLSPSQKQDEFRQILEQKNVGLLVNERLVNMPPTIVPNLHSQIPDDLEFTKQQDDIDNPKEFNYDYILILTKFTVPNELVNNKKSPRIEDRIYYRWEDSVFELKSQISFCYQSTFKEYNEDGSKYYVQGACAQAGGGKETQYRLIYLIKWTEYVKQLPRLEQIVNQKPNKK